MGERAAGIRIRRRHTHTVTLKYADRSEGELKQLLAKVAEMQPTKVAA